MMRFLTYLLLTMSLVSVPTIANAGHLYGCSPVYRSHPRSLIYRSHFAYRPAISYSVRVPAYRSFYRPSCLGYGYVPSYSFYSTRSYVLPPVYASPSTFGYGIAGIRQFLDSDRLLRQYSQQKVIIPRRPAKPQEPVEVRKPNEAAVQLASKYIGYGDKLFGENRFHEALSRYKTAINAAPNMAELHFRKGHALVAVKQNDLALKAFNRGYELLGDETRGSFTLDDLYQGNRSAKIAHMEQLAKVAVDNPNDASSLLLLGLSLHYDGEADRAQKFFARALAMTTGYDSIAIRFLAPQRSNASRVAATSNAVEL